MIIPKHFLKKEFLIDTVIFDTLFSIGFLAIYRPFSDTVWLGFAPAGTFFHSAAFYLCGITVLLVSKWLFYRFESSHQATDFHLSVWVLCEFVTIALIYILFSDISGSLSGRQIIRLLPRITLCVALILIIPLSFCYQYVKVLDAREEIRILKMNAGAKSDSGKMINFFDHSGALKINASPDNIYFIESQDNYVNIHYMGGDRVESYLLRNSTSQIEALLEGTSIVRCHRSFMVNLDKIKLFKHDRGRATIILDDPKGTSIPVSKSYYQDLFDKIVPDKIVRD